MKSKIEEYLFDFIEKELSAPEAASVAAEIRSSARLKAEVADIQAVRAEIKNTQKAYAAAAAGVDLAKLHAKIMSQVESL
jgi:hypothetical protein